MTDSLGMRIRLARVRQGVRQTELARRIGISGNAMNQIELGDTDPRASRIKAIATELGVSADYLLGLSESTDRAVAASQRQAPPTPAPGTRHPGRAANGTRTAPAPVPAAVPRDVAGPLPLCPHCAMPMQPLGDGQRMACPGCRYSITGET